MMIPPCGSVTPENGMVVLDIPPGDKTLLIAAQGRTTRKGDFIYGHIEA